MEKKRIIVSASSGGCLASNMLQTSITPHIEINVSPTFNFSNLCIQCGGTGEVKAMRMVMTYDAGSVRGSDTKVKCAVCHGKGTVK